MAISISFVGTVAGRGASSLPPRTPAAAIGDPSDLPKRLRRLKSQSAARHVPDGFARLAGDKQFSS
jgi:hypothetical protein